MSAGSRTSRLEAEASSVRAGTVVRAAGALWRETIGGLVLLLPGETDPIVLSPSAALLWDLIAEPSALDHVVAQMARAYDVDPARVERDIRPLLDELGRRGAIQWLP